MVVYRLTAVVADHITVSGFDFARFQTPVGQISHIRLILFDAVDKQHAVAV